MFNMLRIKTNAEAIEEDLVVLAMKSLDEDAMELRTKTDPKTSEEHPKLIDGRETYAVPKAMVLQDGNIVDKVYVSLFAPTTVKANRLYRLAGDVVIMRYGEVLTITADGLELVD